MWVAVCDGIVIDTFERKYINSILLFQEFISSSNVMLIRHPRRVKSVSCDHSSINLLFDQSED